MGCKDYAQEIAFIVDRSQADISFYYELHLLLTLHPVLYFCMFGF